MASAFDTEQETPELETLARLAENLVLRLPGCADVMVRKTLQEVCRDFCRRSCCLCGRRSVVLHQGQATASVSPTGDGEIESVTDVYYRGRRLLSHRDYDVRPAGRSTTVCLAPHLVPPPTTADDFLPRLDIDYVEIPALNAESVPADLIRRHGEHLCDGVVARLMRMSGRPWSDAQQAAVANMAYENAVGEARLRFYANGERGNGYAGYAGNTAELI